MFNAAILTVSDSGFSGHREDTSGENIASTLVLNGFAVIKRAIVPDEIDAIKHELSRICNELKPALLLTTGGTGLSPRDVTPEATAQVIERMCPGISEAMRAFSLTKTKRAMLSRGISGILGTTLIINLPGSPNAATECLEFIMEALPHGLEVLAGAVRNCAELNT